MNDGKIAARLRAQLKKFLGELLPHFSRPKVAFPGDMFYGLMAGGDVKLSKICRAYRPNITMKKAGDRLCMHLGDILVSATGGKGIFIYDRGGDNIEFFRYFLRKDVDSVARLKSRHVISWKRKLLCGDLAEQCIMRYADSITFDSHGIKMILSRCGRWTGFDEAPDDDEPDLSKFFDCDDRVGRKS